MNYETKLAVVAEANRRRSGISDEKGAEYAGQAERYKDSDQDVLANFKRQDARWGFDGSGIVSAMLYFGKHSDSIETFARELRPLLERSLSPASDPDADAVRLVWSGEGIQSRLDDARNYLDLLECLLVDAGLLPAPPLMRDGRAQRLPGFDTAGYAELDD